MHVLMTADTLGGVIFYSLDLASFLVSRGLRVTLATMGRMLESAERERIRALGIGVEETEFRLEWMDDPWQDVEASGRWLLEVERRYQPDVIHVNGYAHASLDWRAPVIVVAHSCVLSWWRAVLGEDTPPRYARYRDEVVLGLSAARAVVAPTRAMLESLALHYGPVRNGRVIHNGVQLPREEACPKEPFILAAGRLWDVAKNVRLLSEAAADVSWPCYVAGERVGPDGRAIVGLDGVVPLGPLAQSDLARWMARASIFAAPALYEPFGLAILEAACKGCALVLGDIPSLRELWAGAAVFVDPRDPAALARALRQLTEDDQERRNLGKLARQKARFYAIERAGNQYLELYGARSACTPGARQVEAHL